MTEKTEVTERATTAGWTLPDGWRVWASTGHDDSITELSREGEAFADPVIARAWREDEWEFAVVTVEVVDDDGREWGASVIGAVVSGSFPTSDGTVRELDPLTDGEHPLPQMIREALDKARFAVAEFTNAQPEITGPNSF